MIIVDCIQGSQEWFAEKAGKPSASHFEKILSPTGIISKQRTDYLYQLAGERLTGKAEETYTNQHMQTGLEREAEARLLFELIHGDVKQVGMVYRNERKRFLCSPDGLLEDSGLEIKCPMTKTHVKYLLNGGLPNDYFCQVQGAIYVTGLCHWWFMSYCPGLEPFILKVERDEAWIEKLAVALELFCNELDEMVRRLRDKS